MKVKITNDFKHVCTVDIMPHVKKVIESMKEDTGLKDYAKMALTLATGANSSCFELLKTDAEICFNSRVWNAYTEDSEKIDIWITVYAYNNYYGFYDIGICLSDIWQICSDKKINESVKEHMYIKHYTQNK